MCAKCIIQHEAGLHSSARNLPHHIWPMSIKENRKPKLGLKDIGRLMGIGDN